MNGRGAQSKPCLKHGKAWEEVMASLEVCKSLGVHFNEDKEVILGKLVELEQNLEDCLLLSASFQRASRTIIRSVCQLWVGIGAFDPLNGLTIGYDKTFLEEVNNVCSKERGMGIDHLLKKCRSISKQWVSERIGPSTPAIRELEKKCSEPRLLC
ncbi:hypothetical protein V6N13_105081 [Hibiscus sabdariffa]